MNFENLRMSDDDYGTKLDASGKAVQGLEWVHSKGIMRRDVTPTNIFVSFRPEPITTTTDFAHAILADQSTDHLKGAVHYLAPEIRALKDGQKTAPYDKRADIWPLAYTLFDLHHRAKGYKENSDLSLTLFHELALKNLRQRRLPIDGPIDDMFAWEATDRVASSEIRGVERMARNWCQTTTKYLHRLEAAPAFPNNIEVSVNGPKLYLSTSLLSSENTGQN